MTKNVELKLQLLHDFEHVDNPINFCREAYKFLTEDDEQPKIATPSQNVAPTTLQDGIYLVYADGSKELFNGENELAGVSNVAFKFGHVSLKLYQKDIETDMCVDDKDDDDNYVDTCDGAVNDYDDEANTKDLIQRGWKAQLPDGYFCASLGQLYIMYPLKDKLNDALRYIGHEPIEDTWYWSSTEGSATDAWALYFSNGYLNGNSKTSEYRVRPVSAFV